MRVMAVAFHDHGRLHYLDAGAGRHAVGDRVLVPTEAGPEVARCVWGPADVDWHADLPVCGGAASAHDLLRDDENRRRRAALLATVQGIVDAHGLPMTVVAIDHVDAHPEVGRLVAVYYKAPHRVDFRALIGDLARTLQARVDLRQVGSRDVAALVGDVGACGRELCCTSVCPAGEPLPNRVSRDQEIANVALALAGTCGRLKCCLTFEAGAYADYLSRAPRPGCVVATASGEGVVSGYAMPIDSVWVRTPDGLAPIALGDATVVRPAPGS